MSYARARLWLGITGVGTIVMASTVVLFTHAERLLPHDPLASFSVLFIVYAAISFPFDMAGGYGLPCRHGRICRTLPAFLLTWLRGVLMQGVIMIASGVIILAAGQQGGFPLAFAAVLALMLTMLQAQLPMAKIVGGLREEQGDLSRVYRILTSWKIEPIAATLLSGVDEGFSGGIVGLPGRERLVLPALWLQTLSPEAIALQIARRLGALSTGGRTRGLALALGWNLTGFALACWMPGASVVTPQGLATIACWFTFWSFAGLMLLPSLSRPAVLEMDRFALQSGVPAAIFERSLSELDQLQDDEPSRPPLVETIFHPVPSVAHRRRHPGENEAIRGAWHAARTALYLSWACLGFLPRAVHCNSGRPELWVLFPSD